MGNSLAVASGSCFVQGHDGLKITYGAISCSGGRGTSDGVEMEDGMACGVVSKDEKKIGFGVFDGHSGRVVADDLTHHLPQRIVNSDLSAQQISDICLDIDATYCAIQQSGSTLNSVDGTPGSRNSFAVDEPWARTLPGSGPEAKAAWRQRWQKRQDSKDRPTYTPLVLDKLNPATYPGSTATMAIVDLLKSEMTIMQVGDSRCLIVSEQKDSGKQLGWKQPLQDHSPSDVDEMKRIKAAGHSVEDKRVDNKLAMSRTFGSYCYKDSKNKLQTEQAVIALPDVAKVSLHKSDLVMLFTDGVQERNHDNDKLVELLHREMTAINKTVESLTSHDMVNLAQRLCYLASATSEFHFAQNPSGDNITIVLFKLTSEVRQGCQSLTPWNDSYPVWHTFPNVVLSDANLYHGVNLAVAARIADKMATRFGRKISRLAETPLELFLRARLSLKQFSSEHNEKDDSKCSVDDTFAKEIEEEITHGNLKRQREADLVEAKRVERATVLPDVKRMKTMNGAEIRRILGGYTMSELWVLSAEVTNEKTIRYQQKAQYAILRLFRDAAGEFERTSAEERCTKLLRCWQDTFQTSGSLASPGLEMISPLTIIRTFVTIMHENTPPTMEHLHMLENFIQKVSLPRDDWCRWYTNVNNFKLAYHGPVKCPLGQPWQKLVDE